jgi:hypothetical protein
VKLRVTCFLAAVLGCACSCSAGLIGPVNNYGYFIAGSSAPFVDITSTGTKVLAGTDDATVAADLGFSFSLMGESYGSAWISSDGLMGFGTPDNSSANVSLADPSLGALIAPLWQDWQFFTPGTDGVFYETMGTPGNEEFIVEWHDAASTNFLAPGLVTFEAILYEGSNDALFSYGNLNTGNAATSSGAAATVGVSGGSAGEYVEYSDASYDPDGISSNSSLLVDPPPTTVGQIGVVEMDDPGVPEPEPTSLLLMGSGLLALASATRRSIAGKKRKTIS